MVEEPHGGVLQVFLKGNGEARGASVRSVCVCSPISGKYRSFPWLKRQEVPSLSPIHNINHSPVTTPQQNADDTLAGITGNSVIVVGDGEQDEGMNDDRSRGEGQARGGGGWVGSGRHCWLGGQAGETGRLTQKCEGRTLGRRSIGSEGRVGVRFRKRCGLGGRKRRGGRKT